MTLTEKNEKQRKVINEMFAFLDRYNSDHQYVINFIASKVKRLFKIEMDYLGYSCLNERSVFNQVEIKIAPIFMASAAAFSYSKPTASQKEVPLIEINTNMDFKELNDWKKEIRIDACRSIINSLFHEMKHLKQHFEYSSGMFNLHNLKLAREEYLKDEKGRYFYVINHNFFIFELEAIDEALRSQADLDIITQSSREKMNLFRPNQDVFFILSRTKGFVDRDGYVADEIEELAVRAKNIANTREYRFLQKEYHDDGTPIRLAELINNCAADIEEIERSQIEDHQKEILINDLKEMYNELYRTRLVKNNRFEMVDAINIHGKDKVKEILEQVETYVKTEKRRKINVIKAKLEQVKRSKLDKNYFIDNRGFMLNPVKRFSFKLFRKNDLHLLELSTGNEMLDRFLKLDRFFDRLPTQGYFVTKEGSKMSIHDFVHNILVPELEKVEPDFDKYEEIYLRLEKEHFISSYEMDAATCFETANKEYQKNSKALKLDYDLLQEDIPSFSSFELAVLEKVANICDEGDRAIDKYLQSEDEGYDKEVRIKRVDVLLKAALKLNTCEMLNPQNKNYYNIAIANPTVSRVAKDIKPVAYVL